jgi:hypothetical protein
MNQYLNLSPLLLALPLVSSTPSPQSRFSRICNAKVQTTPYALTEVNR